MNYLIFINSRYLQLHKKFPTDSLQYKNHVVNAVNITKRLDKD